MEFLKDKVPFWRQVYYKWMSKRNVPFRKKFFVGYDLDGNTFWELHNYNNPYKPRRIVFPRQAKLNLVDYHLAPQWIQWLRYARDHHPTLDELIKDLHRQQQIQLKAALADKKWKEIPLKKPEQAEVKAEAKTEAKSETKDEQSTSKSTKKQIKLNL